MERNVRGRRKRQGNGKWPVAMKACDIEFTPTREMGVTKRALEIEKTPTQALDSYTLLHLGKDALGRKAE